MIATNFADPCFIEVDSTYYAFATNLYINPRPGQINIQVAVSKDFSTWNLTGIDALPDVGPWSTGTYTWAPDVIQLVSHSEKLVCRSYTFTVSRMMGALLCIILHVSKKNYCPSLCQRSNIEEYSRSIHSSF